jgi:hypothetical protein
MLDAPLKALFFKLLKETSVGVCITYLTRDPVREVEALHFFVCVLEI